MAPKVLTTEDKLEYLLLALSTAEAVRPDYHKLSQLGGTTNANKAQIKFKSIIEKSGVYKLVDGSVTMANEVEAVPATPAKKRGRSVKSVAPTSKSAKGEKANKKVKREVQLKKESLDDVEDGDVDGDEVEDAADQE